MKGGRKNLKRAAEDQTLTLQPGQSIMQVLSLRGSNLIEVMDAKGENALALFPAKFQKSMWIKRGSFVVVDESGRDEAIESGRKVSCVVSQVLFHDQVRVLQKSSQWPDIFKSASPESTKSLPDQNVEREAKLSDDENNEDGLPPLEANTNRTKPVEFQQSDTDSDSDTDS